MTHQEIEIKLKELEKRIKALEQEPILDKIRTEVERYNSYIDNPIYEGLPKPEGMKKAYANCLEIIDKYKIESENVEGD